MTRASALNLPAGLCGGDPAGLSGEEEQAAAGSTGGGLRGLWAARRGPEAPPGGVQPPLRGRTGPRGAAERPERANDEPRGTSKELEAGALWGRSRGSLEEEEAAPQS